MVKKSKFNPLIFLMALGAGGISIIPFAFFQYTLKHGKGLIQYSQIGHGTLSIFQEILFRILELVMIIPASIHLILMGLFSVQLYNWIKTKDYYKTLQNPLKNSSIITPFIAIAMTLNVFIGPIRFFIPSFANNLQSFMLPALIAWSLIWVFLMKFEIKLLKISFENNFDVNKISFGWLLHPFALSMITVTGTGIAALSANANIAHLAAFMSLVSGTMGVFLLSVKLSAIFKSHFNAPGLPDKEFMPSFLIVIPNITLYAISAFRLGHYLEKHLGMHMGAYFIGVISLAFAFETWYFMFGFAMLKDYFKNHFFNKEFYITQWGLVCPFVAYAVLGSFFYAVFIPSKILLITVLITTLITLILFGILFERQLRCWKVFSMKKINCS